MIILDFYLNNSFQYVKVGNNKSSKVPIRYGVTLGSIRITFWESERIFDYLCNRAVFFVFFFSRPFHENFKFLKNCPYDFHEILHSHATPKGAPACAKATKSYGWDVRNIAKISPKMARN